jgi:hypothetical protein
MKTKIQKLLIAPVLLSLLTFSERNALADSITVSETYKDNTVGGFYSSSTDTGTFSASLTVPGLSNWTADNWSNLVVTINSSTALNGSSLAVGIDTNGAPGNFSDFMADAENYGGTVTATSAVFFFQLSDTNGAPVNAYQITFSRSGNTLTINGKTLNPAAVAFPWSIVATNYFELGGAIMDSVACEIGLQGYGADPFMDVSRTINITGSDSFSTDPDDNFLDQITVNGSAVFAVPVVTSVSPASSVTTTNDLLTVQVKATDTNGVANVEFFVNGADYGSGISGNSNLWSMMFALPLGTNVIQTQATDMSGSLSLFNNLTATYVNRQTNANLITFSEHWLDSLQMDALGNPFVASQDVGALNAALQMPGLQSLPASNWSNLVLTVSFGFFYFSNNLAAADSLTASNATFYFYDDIGNGALDGQLKISRSGNTLVLAYEEGNPTYDPFVFGMIADYYFEIGGPIQNDPEPFALALQDGSTLNFYTNISQTIYVNGSDSFTINIQPDQTNYLDNIQISGAADFVVPTNQITMPIAGVMLHWSNSVFEVTGRAGDNVGVADVFYSINHSGWIEADTTDNFTNWFGPATLVPGTNIVAAYAVDASGNVSSTNTASLVYVVSAVLAVNILGGGTVVTNYNGALLQIGQVYSMTARTNAGSAFVGWTGSITTNKPTLTFVMASNLVFTANFSDIARPTNAITAPVANQHWSNAVFIVTGKAGDNVAVANVLYSLNHGGWSNAVTANNWSNWTAQASLAPGTNTLAAYAVDTSGNVSTTNTVSFAYVLSAVLTVHVGPGGTIVTNYSGALLQIGQTYSMTAKTNAGFTFTGWTGSIVTNKTTLTFVMASNLMFIANFADTAKPMLTITAPANGQRMTNALAYVKGTASDNWGVSNVWFQLNGNLWSLASSVNAYTNWTAILTLNAGTNTFKAYAVDLAGNHSATNSWSLISGNAFKLQLNFGPGRPMAGNGLAFNLLLSTNLNGRIQVSSNLINWVTLANFVGTNASQIFRDPAATNSQKRFYRAVIP